MLRMMCGECFSVFMDVFFCRRTEAKYVLNIQVQIFIWHEYVVVYTDTHEQNIVCFFGFDFDESLKDLCTWRVGKGGV